MSSAVFCVCSKNIYPSIFRYGDITTIDIELPKDRVYMMSIDQSSKETGIYLTDLDCSFHLIGSVERKLQDKYRYYENIKLFLKRLVKDRKIGLFVMEDLPPVHRGWALPVLAEFKGIINSWRNSGEIPEFSAIPDDKWQKIMPSTWKSQVIDKSKGKNRFNVKREIALDLVDKFPELRDYFNSVRPSSDYDAFDACGILHGYIAAHYSENSARIAGTKDFHGEIVVVLRTLSPEDLSNKEVLLEGFEKQVHEKGFKLLEMNPNASFYENVRMAASKHPFVITIVKDPLMSVAVRWQHKLGMGDNVLVMYVVRKNVMTKTQIKALELSFAVEIVDW